MLSGPMLTVKVPVVLLPPAEVMTTLKVVSPCEAGARLSTGSTVKAQLLPVWVTVILLASTPVASAQVKV